MHSETFTIAAALADVLELGHYVAEQYHMDPADLLTRHAESHGRYTQNFCFA